MNSRWADRYLDKPTEKRSGGETVETRGSSLLVKAQDIRCWLRALVAERKAREP